MVANKIRCVDCGAELDPWEDAYQWENDYICEDCFDGKVNDLSRYEMAQLMGCEVKKVEEI